jgi:hypothetical protein
LIAFFFPLFTGATSLYMLDIDGHVHIFDSHFSFMMYFT